MTNTPTTLTYSLEEVLARMEQKMDRQFTQLEQKMDKQFAQVEQKFVQIEQKMDKQFAEVNQKLVKLEVGQAELSGEIKTLDEKVSGIGKRMDNQEFINRSVLVAVILAFIGGAARLLGLLPTA